MKTPLTLTLGLALMLILTIRALAQPYLQEKLTFLDDDGKPTKEKKASFLQQVVQLNDTIWETNFYVKDGPRIFSSQSNTAAGELLNGTYVKYRQGAADTLGYFYRGKRNGNWLIYAGGIRLIKELHYEDGQLLWIKDSTQVNRERDSTKAADSSKGPSIESEFPGGAPGWLRFLNSHLRYPDEAVNKKEMGTVIVGFVVDKDGQILPTSLWIKLSRAYPLDKETLKVIYESGKWVPAQQYGRKVKSYKLQPVVFRFQ